MFFIVRSCGLGLVMVFVSVDFIFVLFSFNVVIGFMSSRLVGIKRMEY